MQILRDIYSSVYDPIFYARVKGEGFKAAVKYFARLALILALLGLIVSLATLAPRAYFGAKKFQGDALAYFPPGLEIKVVKGEVSINEEEPYVFRLPREVAEKFKDESSKRRPLLENLAVIDTRFTEEISVGDFEKMRTALFVGKTYIMHYGDDSIVFQDLSDAPDFTLDRPLVEKMLGFADFLPFLIPAFSFLGVFSFVMFQLVWAIILGFMFWLVSLVAKMGLTYAESYKVTAYALTAPIIVGLIALLFSTPMRFQILNIVALAIAFINIRALNKKSF